VSPQAGKIGEVALQDGQTVPACAPALNAARPIGGEPGTASSPRAIAIDIGRCAGRLRRGA
jgi:hypothetical protein